MESSTYNHQHAIGLTEKDMLLENSSRMNALQPLEIRRGFIQKVYGILAAQMFATVLIALPFYTMPEAQEFVVYNPGLVYVALFSTLAFMCVISCNPQIARTHPYNLALLAGFTVCEAFLIGVICVYSEGVLVAAIITAFIVASLTMYAFTTRTDFSGMGPYLFCALIGLLVLQIMTMILQIPLLHSVYAGFGAILFSCYLVYDTQIIVGGKHVTYQICIDDYAFAALVLYLDIINIFLMVLHLVGGGRD